MASNFIVGLDIGTSSTKVAVAEMSGGRVVLRALFKEPSAGMRRGSVNDLSEAVPALMKTFEKIKSISKSALRKIYVNVGTPEVKAQHSKGIVAVSRVDNEIYQDDIDRVTKASQAITIAPNRIIVHNITREFIVDGVPDISNPLGLSGNRLEASSLIIDAFAPHVKNLMRAVEMAGGSIAASVFGPIASARAAVSKKQKELGVVLIDIGSATTGFSVYEEDKLLGTHTFPVGSGNVTNDLAVGLKIPVAAAEALKLHHGHAYSRDVGQKEVVDLKKFSPESRGTVSRRFVSEIAESRLAEILEFVNNELKLLGKSGGLPGGAVITGGGAKIPGLTELAKQELKLATQIGFAIGANWLKDGVSNPEETVEDPEFVNALGLVLWGGDNEGWWEEKESSLFDFKKIVRSLLP
jgi:cell division protein FtsA